MNHPLQVKHCNFRNTYLSIKVFQHLYKKKQNQNFSLHLLGPMTKFSIFNPHKSEQTSKRHETWQELCTKSFSEYSQKKRFHCHCCIFLMA